MHKDFSNDAWAKCTYDESLLPPHFFRTLITIALPIILQNLMQSLVNMLDTIMVGQLGSVAIAAVGLGNQIFFLLNMVLFGVSSGAAIFVAQYWGKKDIAGIRQTLGLALTLATVIATIFTVAAVFAPYFLIGLYSKDPAVVESGGRYLRIVALSYPVTAISFVFAQGFRSTEHVRLPMVATLISLVANGILNYLLIFGIGFFPELGVLGAAVATVISRTLEFAILVVVGYRKKYEIAARLKEFFSYKFDFVARYIRIALPVIINETLWGLGITLQNSIFSHAGTDAISAINICSTISQLTWIFFIGTGTAAAIIIGKRIGAGQREQAIKTANTFGWFMPALAVVVALTLIPLSRMLPYFFNVEAEILQQAQLMLMALMVSYPFKSFNMCIVVGVCRSGGDTIYAALMDVLALWIVALPLGYFTALVLGLQPWIVFVSILVEEPIKATMGFIRLRSKKWLHDVTE